MSEARTPSCDSKSLQSRIELLVFIHDKWDSCMDGQRIVSCGALTPPIGFCFLEDLADPDFEYGGCRVVRRFAPVVTN